ncbi:MAG: NAD kinase [Pseudomonadota bacterium]|jgi:NAD+ kinase
MPASAVTPRFATVGLIGNAANVQLAATLAPLVAYLQRRGRRVLLDERCATASPDPAIALMAREDMAQQADLIIVMGGDGTFLGAARAVGARQVPLVGINLGRLGFMVDIPPAQLELALDAILAGDYQTDQRFLLEGTALRGDGVLHRATALNDVVINKHHVARLIDFDTYIDGHYVNNHRADGLIVATPTGSTAYALSGGGPIMHPQLHAIVLVPICPHALADRPLVVDDSARIEIRIAPRNTNPVQVTWDGQNSLELRNGDRVCIRRSAHPLTLIHPANHDYFRILRGKLRWGSQPIP